MADHWLDRICEEQRKILDDKVIKLIHDVAEYTENMAPHELDELEEQWKRI